MECECGLTGKLMSHVHSPSPRDDGSSRGPRRRFMSPGFGNLDQMGVLEIRASFVLIGARSALLGLERELNVTFEMRKDGIEVCRQRHI